MTYAKTRVVDSTLALTVAVSVGLLVGAAPVAQAGAKVGRIIGTWWADGDKNGKQEHYQLADFGEYYQVRVDEDGGETYFFKFAKSGNPNPDGSGEPVDASTQIALAKQRGGPVAVEQDFWDTPEGRLVSSRAPSLGPVWYPNPGGSRSNPSGDGDYSDGASLKRKAEQTQKSTQGGVAGPFINTEGGTVGEQIKRKQRKGAGSSSSDDGEDEGGAPHVDVSGEELPGPPELVNPAPVRPVRR